MKRAISILATSVAVLTASAAAAAEHTILILPDAYFPQVTYLESGDTVRFVNVSGGSKNIISKNGSWELGPIQDQQEVTMEIIEGVQKTFYDADNKTPEGEYVIEGRMTFSIAPLQ